MSIKFKNVAERDAWVKFVAGVGLAQTMGYQRPTDFADEMLEELRKRDDGIMQDEAGEVSASVDRLTEAVDRRLSGIEDRLSEIRDGGR